MLSQERITNFTSEGMDMAGESSLDDLVVLLADRCDQLAACTQKLERFGTAPTQLAEAQEAVVTLTKAVREWRRVAFICVVILVLETVTVIFYLTLRH